MTPPTNAVKRACDACHRRKVKCDGVNPCRNCTIAQLSCTYNAIPQKKGPKGSRAKVITELRESQRQTSLAARVHNRLSGHNPPPSQNPTLNPSSGLMTSEFVKECLSFYFENLYPKAPIIDRTTIQASIPYMEQDRDVYCLLTSLCAFVMLQPGMSMPSANDPYNFSMNPGSNVVAAQILLEEAQRVRKGYEYMECTNLNTIATCVFLACSLAMLEYQDKAWVEIRKATTLINIANLHTEEAYTTLGAAEAPRARRLFWMLYVMERSFAFSRGRPVTLQSSIHPLTNTDGDLIQLNGFLTLVNTYRPLSSAVLSTWNHARKTLNAQHITALSSQLSDTAEQIRSQDPTAMDLGVNQNWLKDLIWRLSPTGRSNSQGSADGMMGYPVEAARELLFTLSSQFSGRGMELMMHGGLMKTLMETLSNMLNLAPFLPHSRAPFRMGPREYLDELISIVAVVRVGAHQFLPLLFQKTGEVLPRVASTALDEAPEDLNALANMANVDMFDGFGTAGMAQVPQMHVSMDAQHTTMMPMEGPIQAPMQMVTDQHTPPHNHFDNNHSSPAMQLPLDNQSTASMIKMEPQQTPQMQMQMQLPMDNRRLSHQQQQSPQHQHQHQQQQQQQQQQMQMQMGLGTMVEGMEFQTPYAVDEYGIPVENSFGGLQGDQSMRAPMQQRSMSIQGPMQEEMQSDLPGDMQAINGMNNMTNLNMNGMMQIPQNMMANEQHRHGFWS